MVKAQRAKRKSLTVSVKMDLDELSSTSSGQIKVSAMRTSADGRRVYHRTVSVPMPSPSKRQRTHNGTGDMDVEASPTASDELGPFGDELPWMPVGNTSTISSKPPVKRYTSSVSHIVNAVVPLTGHGNYVGRTFERVAVVGLPRIFNGVRTFRRARHNVYIKVWDLSC